jgi:hypothetical protein
MQNFLSLYVEYPKFNPQLFWDTDLSQLDWEEHSNAIIVRALERGNLSDWNEIKRYYGHEKIKEAAIAARNLSKKTLHFVSSIYEVPLSAFRCYKSNLFPELHWMY